MKSGLNACSKFLLRVALLGGAVLLSMGASAAPVVYDFTTAGADIVTFNAGANAEAVVAVLRSDMTITGSFVYDSSAPLVGLGPAGAAYYGAAPNVTTSFSTLSGTVDGMSFSDPRGYEVVGVNIPFTTGGQPTDFVEYISDNESATPGAVHNFSGITLNGVQVVDMRFIWTGAFLSDESLPGAPPSFAGYIALDLAAPAGGSLISNESVYVTNLRVTAAPVPEPQVWTLMAAGLGMIGLVLRRRSA